MKNATSIRAVLVAVLVALVGSSLAGCTSQKTAAKLGLGHITSIAKSKELVVSETGEVTTPSAQIDTSIAAVAFDKDGKVLDVVIDTAQTKVNFDENLEVTSDLTAECKTKKELGEAYGMKRASSIGKEWYEQIAELEKWMVGKTVDEIRSMDVKVRDASHTDVPDVPELTSSVTITVGDYIAAVEEAYRNAVDVKKGGVKLGLGHEISAAKSKTASAQVNDTMAATLFDKKGKVVGTIIDNAQTKVVFDEEGKLTVDKDEDVKSKKELGDAYGMKRASSIDKEWHEQIAELEKWMVGKSVDEIKSMDVKARDAAHTAVPDVPELTSRVTVSVEDYIAAVEEAYENAE